MLKQLHHPTSGYYDETGYILKPCNWVHAPDNAAEIVKYYKISCYYYHTEDGLCKIKSIYCASDCVEDCVNYAKEHGLIILSNESE